MYKIWELVFLCRWGCYFLFLWCFCFLSGIAAVLAFAPVLAVGAPLDSWAISKSLMLLAENFPFNSKFLLALSLFLFLRRSGIVSLCGWLPFYVGGFLSMWVDSFLCGLLPFYVAYINVFNMNRITLFIFN